MRVLLAMLVVAGLSLISGQTSRQTSSGVIVIRGGSSKAPEAKAKTEEAQAEEGESPSSEGAGAPPPGEAAEGESAEEVPQRERRKVQEYVYTPTGQRIPAPTAEQQSGPEGSQSVLLLRNIDGQEVPYLAERAEVVEDTPDKTVVERTTHRYDKDGRPASQQLVREEKRKLPDGTIETVTTTYESDVNGQMYPVERTTAREKVVGNETRTTTTSERPTAIGNFETYIQEESVERKQGENSSTVETVRRVANERGELIESERAQVVMEKAGNVATTQKKVWKKSALNPDRVELHSRTQGELVTQPDGSVVEKVERYGYDAGGARNVNQPGLHLQETVNRETQVTPSGETVQTTTKLSRSAADPSRMGQKEVVKKVAQPTADGERIETRVYEQGVNGRMRQTRMAVERIEKEPVQ